MKFSDLLATCGNGLRRIEPHRHQQRPHLLLEEGIDPAPLVGIALGVIENDDAFALQCRHHLVV